MKRIIIKLLLIKELSALNGEETTAKDLHFINKKKESVKISKLYSFMFNRVK